MINSTNGATASTDGAKIETPEMSWRETEGF